jgi:hypothetical protein
MSLKKLSFTARKKNHFSRAPFREMAVGARKNCKTLFFETVVVKTNFLIRPFHLKTFQFFL